MNAIHQSEVILLARGKFWAQNDKKRAFCAILDKNKTPYIILTLDDSKENSSLPDLKKKLLHQLHISKSEYIIIVDTKITSPDLLSQFLVSSNETSDGLVLENTNKHYSGIKRLHNHLAYNLNISDINLDSDFNLLKRAKVLELTMSTVKIDRRIRERRVYRLEFNSLRRIFHQRRAQKIGKTKFLIDSFLHPLRTLRPTLVRSTDESGMLGSAVSFKGKKFITHTTLTDNLSAINTITSSQKFIVLSLLSIFILGLFIAPVRTMIIFTAILSTIYFIDVLFNLFLITKSMQFPPELYFSKEEIASINDKDLPLYTIMCPLYKEAKILPGFVNSVEGMNYPKNKIDCLLLLEQDDQETIDVAKSMNLPKYIRVIVVPHSFPKTKPKACNYGLSFAKGEFCVIYDAEDLPEPDQLKKAYLGFMNSDSKVACLQAKLNYHNSNQNLLTRFFSAEYSLWFDVVLPGLQSINTTIPLGGTSNHFRTADLVRFEGWDAFNVTEDADLGSRLFKAGYRTAIIDSITLEEANSQWGNWLRQRSRWIKGYMQTYLVHNRQPLEFVKSNGIHALIFQLVVGGKIAFMLINPLLWIMTFSYFALYRFVGPTIESFYPAAVFYMAAFSLVVGNFLFLYYYMIGCAKHGHWSLIKYIYLVPIYWVAISIAASKALYQLVTNPHYWEKTNHGLHLLGKIKKESKNKTNSSTSQNNSRRISIKLPDFISNLLNHKWAGGAFLILSALISNFMNFLYNAYLGNRIGLSEFGLISLFGSFIYLTQVPFSAFSRSVTHISAYIFGKKESASHEVWSYFRFWAFIVSLSITVIWLVASPALQHLFKSSSLVPFLIFAPVWIIGMLSAVDTGFLSGIQKFKMLSLIGLVDSIAKLLLAIFFVTIHQESLVYLSLPLSMVFSFTVGWYYAFQAAGKKQAEEIKPKFPIKFALTSVLSRLSTIVFLGLDIVVAKIILSPEDAGRFALISLIGKMVYFFSSLPGQFIVPLVSKEEGASRNPATIFNKIFLGTLGFSAVGLFGLGIMGNFFVPILFGAKTRIILQYLPFYLLGISCFSLASAIISYHQSRRKYLIPVVSFLVSVLQTGYLFESSRNLSSFTFLLGLFGIIQFLIVALSHRLTRYSTSINQNTFALFDLFKWAKKEPKKFEGQIRFLILNWRDTKHKWAGGAEVYVYELAKNLVAKGHQVTIFCGNDGKSKNREVLEGVEIIRRGGFFTVYIWAALYYIFKFQDRFDIIVDSENGVPFFTPLYSLRPKFLLIHHVHQEFFRENLRFPARQIACFMEKYLMPRFYAREKVMTVSESTKNDVLRLGIFQDDNIFIVNPGIDMELPKKKVAKTTHPTILYLGRLKSYKNVDIAIKTLKKVLTKHPDAVLHIAGEGECDVELRELAKKLKLDKPVVFHGRVTEKEKAKLYAESWIMIQPSSHEGWGITVIEANLFGTPVVASDIPGLRDSVIDKKTGLLVPVKNITAFTKAINKIIEKEDLRKSMSELGIERAKRFNWSENTNQFLSAIERYYLNFCLNIYDN